MKNKVKPNRPCGLRVKSKNINRSNVSTSAQIKQALIHSNPVRNFYEDEHLTKWGQL